MASCCAEVYLLDKPRGKFERTSKLNKMLFARLD